MAVSRIESCFISPVTKRGTANSLTHSTTTAQDFFVTSIQAAALSPCSALSRRRTPRQRVLPGRAREDDKHTHAHTKGGSAQHTVAAAARNTSAISHKAPCRLRRLYASTKNQCNKKHPPNHTQEIPHQRTPHARSTQQNHTQERSPIKHPNHLNIIPLCPEI